MQIAITAAKFTPDEADGLRRAMATFRHTGNVHLFRDKFIDGMAARGYDREICRALLRPDRRFRRIRFSGKPRRELRASGLRLGVDQMPLSGRVLRRHPQQPADGFLSAGAAGARCARSTASRSAKPTSISAPGIARWRPAPILPLPRKRGSDGRGRGSRGAARLSSHCRACAKTNCKKLIAARGNGFSSIERLAAIAGVSRFTIERLAEADAFRSLGLDRRAALWAARRLDMIGIRPPRGGAKSQAGQDCERCRC